MATKKPKNSAPKKKATKSAPNPGGGSRVLAFLKWTATACVWGVIFGIGLVAYFAWDLPDVTDSLAQTRRPTVTVLAADGSVLAQRGDIYGVAVDLSDLPPSLPRAVLATEDRRFYDHFGFDPRGFARAMWANLRAGRLVQGGSTITQQVAKNLFLSPERSIKRKVQELLLAFWLESHLSKDQILTIYLNRVYLGSGTYGVEAAAQRYFGRPARDLTTWQSAMIAGLLKAPSRYNPLADTDRARGRTQQVLMNMVAAGYLSEEQAKLAARNKSVLVTGRGPSRSGRYFIDWIIDRASEFGASGDRDIVVETTLDPTVQTLAEKEIAEILDRHGKAAQVDQVAMVVMDPDGAVRAMVGGRHHGQSPFNRAVQAKRQPGSAFKPFVYLAALESGVRLTDKIQDAPVRIGQWAPENFSGTYEGEVTIQDALAKSLNTPAVRLTHQLGPKRIAATARRLGITSAQPKEATIGLGTGEVSLLELTQAYAPFANGGQGVFAYGIRTIKDGQGEIIYDRQGGGPGRVIDGGVVADMNRMLAAVVQYGTGKRANIDRPQAGKSGTSQDFRDAWFIGYTADRIAGVWMGNDDGTPMKRVTGGGLPATLWARVMGPAHRGIAVAELPVGAAMNVPGVGKVENLGFWNSLERMLGSGG